MNKFETQVIQKNVPEARVSSNNQRTPEIQSDGKQNLPQIPKIKKNRTLQFYKFLQNSLKVEIALNEFYNLIKCSNQAEIALWILSIILYYSGHTEYPLVWVHVLHVLRGILGIVILHKLPRTYELVELITEDDKIMELNNYNDIIRDTVKEHFLPKLKSIQCLLIVYFSLTFANFMIDIVDFLYVVSYFSTYEDSFQMVTLTFVILNFLYIGNYYFL